MHFTKSDGKVKHYGVGCYYGSMINSQKVQDLPKAFLKILYYGIVIPVISGELKVSIREKPV